MISLTQLNSEIENFKTKQIQIVPGLLFNQYDTIQQIYFYYNSKFKSGDIDEDGDRKYFYNIVKNPCKVFSKAIDFDTKNIRMLTTGGGDPLKTWFMERDLKFWMRDKQFGRVLNRIFKELPIFGSVVLKIVDGNPYFVDLRNFVVEQQADDLDSTNFIIEIHNYTPMEFRKVGKDMKWGEDKINKTVEEFRKMKNCSHIRVYERYGEVEEKTNGVPNGKWTYKRLFYADVGIDEYDQANQLVAPKKGVLLSEEEWEGNPYWEFHAEKMGGRWLGIGVVETLIEPQIRLNEISNQQVKSGYWSMIRLFFSQDPSMSGNLLTEKRNGEVITGDAPITQIDMSDRNLAYINDEFRRYISNRDELTFSYDVVQGERLPAGTPLGSAQIAVGQTMSYFEGIQEEVALAIKEMIYKVIIPQFKKESNKEHTIRLVGQDLDKYIEMVKNQMVFRQITKMAIESLNGKPFPTNEDAEVIGFAIEESIKQGKEKILDVPEGFYKDVKYDIDIDITGESIDTRVRQATIFAILQAITADPTMTVDPVKKKILYMMMENGGISPDDIFESEKRDVEDFMMAQNAGKGAGGGVSAPQLASKIPGMSGGTI